MNITQKLFELRDIGYRDFQSKLIPNISQENFIGVRTPDLKKLAKELYKSGDGEAFKTLLPHRYFDENQLHAFIVSNEKDFDKCISEIERFLPYIDNWATCDQLSPKCFYENPKKLLPYIENWLKSEKTYVVRFAIGALMRYFLDELFEEKYLSVVAGIKNDEYYVKMMQAWYFATAAAKQFDFTVRYFKEERLEKWVSNKAIQKANESLIISTERKALLKTFKR